MFAIIAGVILALSFLGLPLAIIGLFIMSIVDQRSPKTGRGTATSANPSGDIVVSHAQRSAERAAAKRREERVAA